MKKIILITGVSSGIGAAFIKRALTSPKVIVVGLGRHNSENVDNKNYHFIAVDLKKESSIDTAIKKVLKNFGRVDVLINNAGIGYRGTIEDMTMGEIRDQFEVNFFGLIYLTKLVLPIMRKQKNGQIINIDSVASTVSTPTLGFYAATKSAVKKISEVLAEEVKQHNIVVSLLVPGAVKSNFGKNIIETKNIESSLYNGLYEEWKLRFRSYFGKHNSSDDVAEKLMCLIEKPISELYVTKKDQWMCYLKEILPKPLFYWLFLHHYYKYES